MRRPPGWVALMMAAASLTLAACGGRASAGSAPPPRHSTIHVQPQVTFALPSPAPGCTGATPLAGGAERLPITVSTVAGQVEEAVNVCLADQGPFPFVIDTGAGESIVDARLATRLGLPHAGQASEFEGVGCTGHAQPVSVGSWSVDGVGLAPQTLTAATLPDFGTKGQPVGLLGSDVLSRFGAVRLDFTAQTLTLGGPQGPAAAAGSVVHGPVGPLPSGVLTQGEVGTTVPLSVVLTPGVTALDVALRIHGGPARTFVVDTGSSQSVVGGTVARAEHLAHTDQAQRQSTVCSVITIPLVRSGPWSLRGVTLRPQLLGVTGFGAIGADGTSGLLGSDQLQRFGWVILDYTGGRLVLG